MELLTSVGGGNTNAVDITLNARDLVDASDYNNALAENALSPALQAKALACGWASSGDGANQEKAVDACRVLSEIAASCVSRTSWRKKPVEVLPLLEDMCKDFFEPHSDMLLSARKGLVKFTTS